MNSAVRPLKGIKVVELSHMVLGPSCGLILADLGADVVKVEGRQMVMIISPNT